MIKNHDIHRIINWATHVDFDEFCRAIYSENVDEIKEPTFKDYASGKYKMMQDNFIKWASSLDGVNRNRLADAINIHTLTEKFVGTNKRRR